MLVYTFRTYPYIKELQSIFPSIFIFSSLKEDLKAFKELLEVSDTNIMGIADTKGPSRLEPIAVNKFNKGKLEISGPDRVDLFIDARFALIDIAQSPTTTFCNWTMYNIQRYVEVNHLNNKVSFIHINMKDLGKLKELSS